MGKGATVSRDVRGQIDSRIANPVKETLESRYRVRRERRTPRVPVISYTEFVPERPP